jgi:hypothetical protein
MRLGSVAMVVVSQGLELGGKRIVGALRVTKCKAALCGPCVVLFTSSSCRVAFTLHVSLDNLSATRHHVPTEAVLGHTHTQIVMQTKL